MSYHNRRWIFLDTANLSAVNFDQVHETSAETLRYSIDGSMFFVKYGISVWTEQDALNAAAISAVSAEPHPELEAMMEGVSAEPYTPPNYEVGDILGRPDCFDLALEINGKVEFNHEEVLEYLATEAWTAPLTGF